jgi:hypothetical protein
MQINGRDAFLYFCVLRAPFRHIQTITPKSLPNTPIEIRIIVPKN